MSDQYDFFNYLKRISLLLIPIDVPIFLSKIGGYVHVGDGCMHFHPKAYAFLFDATYPYFLCSNVQKLGTYLVKHTFPSS